MNLGSLVDKAQSAVDDFFGNGDSGGEKVGNILLGDITINIPPERSIEFTGLRSMVKYDVPGDRPRYQDMGRDERTVRWNGIFYGEGAYSQALKLQSYYDSGINTDDGTEKSGFRFIFGEITCRVLIKSYNYQYYRKDKVRYDIELVRLESDYDKAEPEQKAKTDKITKAKNSLTKLKENIKKGMQVVNDVSRAAKLVKDTLFQARKEFLGITKLITDPIKSVKNEIVGIKQSFDKTLQVVDLSVGKVSTHKARQDLVKAFKEIEENVSKAEELVEIAEENGYEIRLEDLISQMNIRKIYAGDNLRSISTEIYGYPHKWTVLARINNFTSAYIPEEVKEIRVPDSSNMAKVEELLENKIAALPDLQSTYIPIDLR